MLNRLFMRFSPLQKLADAVDRLWDALPPKWHNHWIIYTKQRIDLVWMVLNGCTCGSGGHPRRCRRHPWAFIQHCEELNSDNARGDIEDLEERIEALEKAIGDHIGRPVARRRAGEGG